MHLLLLNTNPAVSRLIKLSVERVGYDLDECETYDEVPRKHYDVVMVDNECFDEASFVGLCEACECHYSVAIVQRGSAKPKVATVVLEKPFLPTDFLALLEKAKHVLQNFVPPIAQEEAMPLDALEEEEESPFEPSPETTPETHAFDIDDLDPFEEDELLEMHEDKEPEIKDPVDFEEEEEPGLDLPTFDLDTKEEDGVEDSFMRSSDLLEEEESEESAPTILDKDEIDEVKQLLNESEEEEEDPLSFDETLALQEEDEESDFDADEALLNFEEEPLPSLETPMDNKHVEDTVEEEEEAPLLDEEDEVLPSLESAEEALDFDDALPSLDEPLAGLESEDPLLGLEDEALEEESLEEETPLVLEEESVLEDEALEEDVLDALSEPTPFEEDGEEEVLEGIGEQVEVIDAFEESLEEPIVVPTSPKVSSPIKKIASLDELNEKDLLRAFGAEVEEEEITQELENIETQEVVRDAEVIRGAIEKSIAQSISSLSQSDILREALKGMRVNISITFDDNPAS